MTKRLLLLSALGLGIFSACSGDSPLPTGNGGTTETGGNTATGGNTPSSTGGISTGGLTTTGGLIATGGRATGGLIATGGNPPATGGSVPVATGGNRPATGGSPPVNTGGISPATGGNKPPATGGGTATGGTSAADGGTSSTTVNCSATMPTSGTDHCGSNTQGNAGGLSWSLWSNAVNANSCITTFSTPAFSARWNNSNDFLARIGLEFSSPKTYDKFGTISADFAYTKTGSAGGYSYIGIYGWSTNPCVEYYIVEDRFGTMPFNAYNSTQKGTATIDGEVYKLFSNTTTGTGGSRCSGVSSWGQFWSIRQKARQCGTISITQHFDAWKAAGMVMGNLLEAKILVETGGGQGTIEFPVATVTAK